MGQLVLNYSATHNQIVIMKFLVLSACVALSAAQLVTYPNGAVVPVDTAEVAAAKAAHFGAHGLCRVSLCSRWPALCPCLCWIPLWSCWPCQWCCCPRRLASCPCCQGPARCCWWCHSPRWSSWLCLWTSLCWSWLCLWISLCWTCCSPQWCCCPS